MLVGKPKPKSKNNYRDNMTGTGLPSSEKASVMIMKEKISIFTGKKVAGQSGKTEPKKVSIKIVEKEQEPRKTSDAHS